MRFFTLVAFAAVARTLRTDMEEVVGDDMILNDSKLAELDAEVDADEEEPFEDIQQLQEAEEEDGNKFRRRRFGKRGSKNGVRRPRRYGARKVRRASGGRRHRHGIKSRARKWRRNRK